MAHIAHTYYTHTYARYDSQPLQPYIIFQKHAYNVYHKHGFLRFAPSSSSSSSLERQLLIDDTKTLAVLDDFSSTFENVLACCDLNDAKGGQGLEDILATLRKESDFVDEVVALCFNKSSSSKAK